MKKTSAISILLAISMKANAFDIWVNEKLWSPPGECMIHAETAISPPMVHCSNEDLTIEIIPGSSFRSLNMFTDTIPRLRQEAIENKAHFIRGDTEYFEVTRKSETEDRTYFNRFILGDRIFVRAAAQNIEKLIDATSQIWK